MKKNGKDNNKHIVDFNINVSGLEGIFEEDKEEYMEPDDLEGILEWDDDVEVDNDFVKGHKTYRDLSDRVRHNKVNTGQRIDEFFNKDIRKLQNIAVVGGRGSGKTCLVYKILESLPSDMDKYIINHPRPEVIDNLEAQLGMGFKNMDSFSNIREATNSLLWLDEPQRLFQTASDKNKFIDLLILLRHMDITIILSTADTNWFDKRLEGYMDCFFVLDIDYDACKLRGKPQKIIKRNWVGNPTDFKLNVGEYYFYCRKLSKYNTNSIPYTFEKPTFWTEWLSKPFSTKTMVTNEVTYGPEYYSK